VAKVWLVPKDVYVNHENPSRKQTKCRKVPKPLTEMTNTYVYTSCRGSMKADLELVRDVKSGDRNAFSELVRRHQKGLYRMIARLTRDQGMAEDVVQEAFIKAYQKINLFEERSSFKSWLFRIAINTANNKLRARRADTVSLENVNASVQSEAERQLVYRDLQKLVAAEMERLPERQRMALTLRIFEDLSFSEIAQVMDCPYDTAKANYRHALLKLKAALEQTSWLKNLHELDESEIIKLKEMISEVDS
jgi:RNA polymerase sigma-70 factor, ECF subfamily